MSRRGATFALAVIAALVIARCLPFMAPGVRFDADQAVVGLMAKHISEGRAFPLYYYGQNYLLAIEAYLAAPVMWLLGPSEIALKLPVLLMNVGTATLLVWHGIRGAGLSPVLATIAALPLAVPPIVVGTRLMEAMGGNVETPFYALLLWTVRRRPWLFGAVTAVAVAHRELVVYPLAALALLDAVYARGDWRRVVRRWTLAVVLTSAVATLLLAVRPFAPMFGPGTTARAVDLELSSAVVVGAQVCLDTARLSSRAAAWAGEHLPLMVGGRPGTLQVVGVNSGMGQGNPGLASWVAALLVCSLVAAAGGRRRSGRPEGNAGTAMPMVDASPTHPAGAGDTTPDPGGTPATALPWFLMLSGLASTLVYAFVSCAQLTPAALRYDLLVLAIPAGALMAGLGHRRPAVRAGLATAAVLWTVSSADDYRALAGEILRGHWPDERAAGIAALDARGLTTLWGDYRLAYVVTFRTAERITVASVLPQRIDEYADRARAARAPLIKSLPCAGGEALTSGMWLCPPP